MYKVNNLKLLILLAGYFPAKNYGGPPVSIFNLCKLIRDKIDIYIMTSNHDYKSREKLPGISDKWVEFQECRVMYLSDDEWGGEKVKKEIRNISPEIVYVNAIYNTKLLRTAFLCRKLCKTKIIVAPRGGLYSNAINGRKPIIKRVYLSLLSIVLKRKNTVIHATTNEELQQIRSLLHMDTQHSFVAPNIVALSKIDRKMNKRAGMIKAIYMARIVPHKNLLFALECLEKVQGKVEYDIYGPIEDTEYWGKCKKKIEHLPSNISVTYKGVIEHEDVHGLYSKYDILLLPTKSENYGQSIAEAMMAGCIPVISDNTPWNEINRYNCGYALSLEDQDAYSLAIDNLVKMDESEFQFKSMQAYKFVIESLNLENVKKVYLSTFTNIVNNQRV